MKVTTPTPRSHGDMRRRTGGAAGSAAPEGSVNFTRATVNRVTSGAPEAKPMRVRLSVPATAPALPQELADRLDGAGGAHQGLAEQERGDAGALQALDVLVQRDPRLGHHHRPGGDVGQELEGRLDVHLERVEVAVVDADQLGAGLDRGLDLLLVVDLDERVQAEVGRRAH